MGFWDDFGAGALALPTLGTSFLARDAMQRTNSPANPEARHPQGIVQQHTKEFDLPKLGDDQIQEQIRLFRNLLDQRRDVPGDAAAINDHLARLEAEASNRQTTAKETQGRSEIERILGQGVQGQGEYEGRQRQNLEDIFNNARTSGETRLRESQASDRGRTIDEAAAMGLSRVPGFLTKTLGDVDARGQNSLRDFNLGLEGQRAQGRLGLEDTLFGRGTTQQGLNLQRAGLVQGGNQFGQNFGLQNAQFGEQKRQNSLQDIFNQNSLTQADRVGRLQADAAKPTFLDQFAQVTGGLGSLLGGVGSLYGKRKVT